MIHCIKIISIFSLIGNMTQCVYSFLLIEHSVRLNDEINFKLTWQDSLLEKKEKGEFQPSGSVDVLSTALETPEHSGRVRGVGGFVTPKLFFNLPKDKRKRITKAELLACDRQRDEEMERTKQELMSQIEALKAMINTPNIMPSPMTSDKASCQPVQFQEREKEKPIIAKELLVSDDECVVFDTPPEKKVKS